MTARHYTEAEIRREANVPATGPIPKHGGLLYHALACWAGLPYEHRTTGLYPSRNMWALIMGPLAHRDPVLAAKVIVRTLTAELRSTALRGRRRYFGGDELLSGEPYTSWWVLGMLLALRALSGRSEAICREACRLIVEALNRQAALLALVAAPTICRWPNGKIGYVWLGVRCAGLRSLPGMLRWSGLIAAVWGLLGGPESAWQERVPILAEAIADLALRWRSFSSYSLFRAATMPADDHPYEHIRQARETLGDTRTMIDLEIRHYRSGARLTMLLGPGAGGTTAGMRAVLVRGPECPLTEEEAQRQLDAGGPIRCGDVTAAYPEPKERERGDEAGDGWIERDDISELYVCTDGPGRTGKRVEMGIGYLGDPVFVVRTTQDSPPVWRIAA